MPLCTNAGRNGPPRYSGSRNGSRCDEVRRNRPCQRAPLVVRLADEPHVAEAQVAEASVDELGGGARRARAEVARVDERHGEPFARGVRSGRSADHAAADHEQVEVGARERLPGRRPGQQRVRPRLPPRRVDDLDTGERRRLRPVEPCGDDQAVRRRLEHVRAVAVPEPAGVDRGPARPPGQERHRARRGAADDHLAVVAPRRRGPPARCCRRTGRRAARRGRSPPSARRASHVHA